MSKKARALMESMTPIINRGLCGFESTTKADAKIEALIDAALREERERAADRLRSRDHQSTSMIRTISIDDAIDAILADEED